MTAYQPGALVSARGRDWVVMPADEQDVLRLRPVDGADEDTVGIYIPIEGRAVDQAQYPAPNPEAAGDFAGGLLLRDAARLNLRSGAGPFRSMGRLSVAPRPYQFVPLIMALRQVNPDTTAWPGAMDCPGSGPTRAAATSGNRKSLDVI